MQCTRRIWLRSGLLKQDSVDGGSSCRWGVNNIHLWWTFNWRVGGRRRSVTSPSQPATQMLGLRDCDLPNNRSVVQYHTIGSSPILQAGFFFSKFLETLVLRPLAGWEVWEKSRIGCWTQKSSLILFQFFYRPLESRSFGLSLSCSPFFFFLTFLSCVYVSWNQI